MSENKAAYRPLKNDGALFRCLECDKQGTHSEMWFITIPNGHRGVYHKDCLESDWIALAEFVNQPI